MFTLALDSNRPATGWRSIRREWHRRATRSWFFAGVPRRQATVAVLWFRLQGRRWQLLHRCLCMSFIAW